MGKLEKSSPKKTVKFEVLSDSAVPDPKTRSCRKKLEIESREQLKKRLEELKKIEKEFQEEFAEESEEDSVPSKTRSGRITRTSRQLMIARTADDSDKAEQEIDIDYKKKVLEKLREDFAEKLDENPAPSKTRSIEVYNKYSGKKYSERVREIMEKNKNIDQSSEEEKLSEESYKARMLRIREKIRKEKIEESKEKAEEIGSSRTRSGKNIFEEMEKPDDKDSNKKTQLEVEEKFQIEMEKVERADKKEEKIDSDAHLIQD